MIGVVPLAVILEEACNAGNGIAQVILVRQENQAEMIRMRPVETTALHQQHFLFLQQFRNERLIVLDRIDLRIELREHIQGGLGLDAGHPRNRRDQLVRDIALATQTTTFLDQVINTLIAAQRRLDTVLPRRIDASMSRPSM